MPTSGNGRTPGRVGDWRVVEPGGWGIGDPDIAELFGILGASVAGATAVDLSHHGRSGGYSSVAWWIDPFGADAENVSPRWRPDARVSGGRRRRSGGPPASGSWMARGPLRGELEAATAYQLKVVDPEYCPNEESDAFLLIGLFPFAMRNAIAQVLQSV